MINNNYFSIPDLKKIIIIGACPNIDEIIRINKKLKIQTIIVTSKNQKKFFSKNIKLNLFDDLDNSKFHKFVKENCKIDNTIFLSISSMFIFSLKTINFLNGNLINYFPSRLPYDAGRGGFSWHIMREDRILNNSFHIIDKDMNTGPIIINDAKIFPSNCKVPLDYENFKWDEMNKLYAYFIKKVKNGDKFFLTEQANTIGRFNPALNTLINGFIDWNMKSYDLYNFINAFDEPHGGASTYINNKKIGKVFIKNVHLHGGDTNNHPYFSGIISRHDKDWITVCTSGKHMLLIEKVLNENGENIIKLLKPGDRFFTPSELIEKSKIENINYKP